MKQDYLTPQVEAIKLSTEDVILTTSNLDLNTENQPGYFWDE